jgi:hypothetical protein
MNEYIMEVQGKNKKNKKSVLLLIIVEIGRGWWVEASR